MLKKLLKGLCIFFACIYILFLIVPFLIGGIVNSYSEQIAKIVEENTGFKVKIENIRAISTPKLTIGAGVEHLEAALPNGETFLTVDNAGAKLSLLPLLLRKIEIDAAGAENLNINLKVKKDGKFLIEDYIPKSEPSAGEESNPASLPFGLKLSNHLPNITVKSYNVTFVDMLSDKNYSIFGEKFAISDFILNKKIKVTALGKFQLHDRVQFNYDLKVLNKIMPDLDLNNLVFPSETEPVNTQPVSINIIEIFKTIYNNQVTADLKGDITAFGTFDDMKFNGFVNLSNLGIAVDGKKLPQSSVDLKLNGNKIDMYTKLYTAEKEITELVGKFKTGKHPYIDLNCKSNAQFKSVIDMIDSIAKSVGYKELDTLSAAGGINADFSIKSNLKKVESSGYLKVPSASLAYGLYNIAIKNINADIDFSNNMINIKNAGLSVLEQPLKIRGTIQQDAQADINVSADRLQIRGLLLALGQMALLKENSINSGTVTLNVLLKGKLDKIIPDIKLSVDNVNIKNIPSNTVLAIHNTIVNLVTDGKKNNGNVSINNAKIINPAAQLTAPEAKITLGEKDIDINKAYVLFNGKRIDLSGKIYNYLSPNLKLDITANGPGCVHLKGDISDIYSSQKLNLNLNTSKTVAMEIPGFKNSNFKTDFNINIGGNAINPILTGSVSVPVLKIPDMAISMENLNINLNGPIVTGKGTLKKFVSGGIIAENLSADFKLLKDIFYLKNITGDAFSGKVNGNVSYNITNGHIGVDFKGSGMNAEHAIEGAAGINNALSGILGFNAKVTLFGATDIEMMKNLKGKVSFDIQNGQLGNIGRFENFLFANNISSNSILKAAVNSVSALPAIKNTAEFKYIKGDLTFKNGWVNLSPVKMSGNTMAYYVTGKYNLLNATANVIVLGRLSAETVKLLGPLGDLSVEKLTSFIPKFGNMTGKLINAMTTDPKNENIAAIPALASGNKNYKDFKVNFNGGVESRSSVKSFKWLSKCDTSAIETVTIKEQVQNTKQAVQDAYKQKSEEFSNHLQQQREQAQRANQQFRDAKEGLKNLKKLF